MNSEATMEPRVTRRVFNIGVYAVSVLPRAGGFAFAIYHPAKGEVNAGEGFDCLGLAESAARAAAAQLVVEGLIVP